MRVYTYGVFDLLHYGHVNSLKQALEQGDELIVGVFTDKQATAFKREPMLSEEIRKKNIESLGIAKMVIYQENFSPEENATLWNCDIIAKGPGADFENTEFKNFKKVLLKRTPEISTTKILTKINANYQQQSNR